MHYTLGSLDATKASAALAAREGGAKVFVELGVHDVDLLKINLYVPNSGI